MLSELRAGLPAGEPKGGFSLIELAIAVAVLTTISLSSLLVLLPVSRQGEINREVDVAAMEMRQVIENVQSAAFSDIPILYPDGSRSPVSGLENGELLVTYEDPNADPLVMKTTLSWKSEAAGSITRTFWTVRTK